MNAWILICIMHLLLLKLLIFMLKLFHLWLVGASLTPRSFWHNPSIFIYFLAFWYDKMSQTHKKRSFDLARQFRETVCCTLNFRMYGFWKNFLHFPELLFYKIFKLKESLQWYYYLKKFFCYKQRIFKER